MMGANTPQNPYGQQGQPGQYPPQNPYGQQPPYPPQDQPPYGGQQPPYGQPPQGNPYGQQGQLGQYPPPPENPYGQQTPYPSQPGAVPPYAPYGQQPGYPGAPGGYYQAGTQARYAGFWWRFLAVLIDGIIIGIPLNILAAALGLGSSSSGSGSFNYSVGGGGSLLTTVLFLLYEVLTLTYWNGQTIGKKICGVRVVNAATGGAVNLGQSVIRYLMKIVSGFVLLLGYLWMLWDPNKQTWHDKVAKTYVIKL